MFEGQKLLGLLLIGLLAATALSQEVPAQNPDEVWVKGRRVYHSWQNGRIMVDTEVLQPLLGIGSEFRQMDLVETLEKRGDYVWSVSDGKFEAKRDRSQYSVGTDTRRARAQNRRAQQSASYSKPTQRDKKSSEGLGLKYEVVEIDTEWGYKWGAVRVTNESGQPTQPCIAYCEFQDGFGRTYAEDWWPVRGLEPGESQQFEISSGTETRDTSITPTSNNIAVYFMAEGSASNPKSRREAMEQARKNKKNRGMKRVKLDLNKNEVRPQNQSNGIGW